MKKAPFVRPGPDKAIWGPLIEKAFAKFHGSYESIVGGNPANGVRFLTGAPADIVKHSETANVDAFWKKIKGSFEKQSYITSGS